jgi:translation initiation factor IF-3
LRRPPPKRYEPTNKYRVNRQIRVPQVRLVNAENEQVGVVSTDEARRIADQAGLDLVEVQPNADPPVCRVMDFGKFKYSQKKKERGQSKAHSTLKELRVRPAIDPHDLEYRLVQGRKFLEEGHKVQVVCIFRGRQRAHPELGYNVMKRVTEALSDISKVESQPRMTGPRLTMLLTRKAGHAVQQASPSGGAEPAAPRPASGAPAPAPPPAPRAPGARGTSGSAGGSSAGRARPASKPPAKPPAGKPASDGLPPGRTRR